MSEDHPVEHRPRHGILPKAARAMASKIRCLRVGEAAIKFGLDGGKDTAGLFDSKNVRHGFLCLSGLRYCFAGRPGNILNDCAGEIDSFLSLPYKFSKPFLYEGDPLVIQDESRKHVQEARFSEQHLCCLGQVTPKL